MHRPRRSTGSLGTRLLASLAILASACGMAEGGTAPFRRGVAIHSLLNWGTLERDRPDLYAREPFSDADHQEPPALLGAIAPAGFDFARLTVDPGPFLQLQGAARDGLDATLVATVRRLRALGLSVIVDLHGNTQVPAYDPVKVVASADGPLFRDYVAFVRRTARLLGGLKDERVAFELMNEPPYGYDPESRQRWQSMLETLHAAARAEAPALTLILSGAHGGDAEGLVALDPAPFRDSRVLYSFHYYEPHDFTHQGVPESGFSGRYRQYLSDLPYPSNSLPRAMVENAVNANIDADPGLNAATRLLVKRQASARIDAYLRSNRNRAAIARDFDVVSAWATRHGIPPERIVLGEFGATRSYDNHRAADPISYESWIGDVRSEAEARGFGWAIWALTGTGGMALVATDGGSSLDPGSLRALGLRDPNGAVPGTTGSAGTIRR